MYSFYIEDWEKSILEKINYSDLYLPEEKSYGIENETHITILYGFHDDETSIDILYDYIKDIKIPIIKFSNVSVFENEDFEVLKFDIVSDDMIEINKIFKNNFKYTSDYENYHPHMTIAYLKKGSGINYIDKFKNIKFDLKNPIFKYSKSNKNKIYFKTL